MIKYIKIFIIKIVAKPKLRKTKHRHDETKRIPSAFERLYKIVTLNIDKLWETSSQFGFFFSIPKNIFLKSHWAVKTSRIRREFEYHYWFKNKNIHKKNTSTPREDSNLDTTLSCLHLCYSQNAFVLTAQNDIDYRTFSSTRNNVRLYNVTKIRFHLSQIFRLQNIKAINIDEQLH